MPEVCQPVQDFPGAGRENMPGNRIVWVKGDVKINFVPTMPMPPAYARFLGPRAAGGLLLWVIMLFVLSAVLMWLWNTTMTKIFGLREVTYWEAFRLLIIAAILFGRGFGFSFHL